MRGNTGRRRFHRHRKIEREMTRNPHGIAAELATLPSGLPVIVLLDDAVTLVGTYTADVEVLSTEEMGDTVRLTVTIPPCSCPDPQTDVDPDCSVHYPNPPAELLVRAALAVAASRGWARGPSRGELRVAGAGEADVHAAEAVLDVLLRPGRSGVLR